MYPVGVIACYHTDEVDVGDSDAKFGHDIDTPLILRRVVDVIIRKFVPQTIEYPVEVTVDADQRCLGRLRVTVTKGDRRCECRLLTQSIGRRVLVNVDQLTYVTR